jgi:hypothetical protein
MTIDGSGGIQMPSNVVLGSNTSSTLRINAQSTTTVGAAGGASALPATPLGYIVINVNATNVKIPYYNT